MPDRLRKSLAVCEGGSSRVKILFKIYRRLKPVAVYTSYLFTVLTVLYLAGHTVFPETLHLHAGILWGIFLFSLGSVLVQRIVPGSGLLKGVPYRVRLLLYLCITGIWGYGCLYFSEIFGICRYRVRTDSKWFFLIFLTGFLGCAGFEVFNRCRAHMYNTLLERYKKRRQS